MYDQYPSLEKLEVFGCAFLFSTKRFGLAKQM